jgi:hypothetical protein
MITNDSTTTKTSMAVPKAAKALQMCSSIANNFVSIGALFCDFSVSYESFCTVIAQGRANSPCLRVKVRIHA